MHDDRRITFTPSLRHIAHWSPGMNNLYHHLSFVNYTVLCLGMQQVAHFLHNPTVVYHEDSAYIDTTIQSIAGSQTFFVAKAPELPDPQIGAYKPKSIILLAANPKTIVPKLRSWGMWNGHSRILVIVDNLFQVREWIDSLWSATRAVDVLVMLLTDVPEFYAWFPYKPNECRDVVSIVKLNDSNLLFPAKINPPLINCTLFAVASPLPPIVVDDFDGMETRLFRDFAQKLGMNAAFVDLPPNTYVWSLFDESGSPMNGMKLLTEYEVDLMFGQMSPGADFKFSDFLVPHYIDEMVWFVPGPEPAPPASAIYRGFSLEIWVCVIITYFILFLTYAINSEQGKTDITAGLLLTLGLTVNLPHKLSISRTLKCLAIASYAYSLHITTAYQSSLIIFLSDSPKEKPIRDLEDLSETNLKVQFHEGHKPIVENLAENNPEFSKLKRENRLLYTSYLDLIVVEKEPKIALLGPKIAFGFSLLQDRYYDEYGHPSILMLPETVFTAYMTFHVSLGHPLKPFIAKTLQHLIEAGMVEHYIRDLSKQYRPRLRHLEPFDMKNVIGPFQLYMFLVLLCILAWIIEWLCYGWHLFRNRNNPRTRVSRMQNAKQILKNKSGNLMNYD